MLEFQHSAKKTPYPDQGPRGEPLRKRQIHELSRRERQLMEIVYRLDSVTVSQVIEELPDPPSYSAVRALLRVLEQKGYLRHRQDGPRYVYLPTVPRHRAVRSALKHMVRTFFDGSPERVVATLLEMEGLTPEELENLSRMIEQARKEGR